MSLPVNDKFFTLLKIHIALLNADNSFGTPGTLKRQDDFDYDFTHDSDQIKSGGQMKDGIEIATHIEGSISNAAFDFAVRAILTGDTSSQSSTASGIRTRMKTEMGGGGTPYVGIVAVYALEFGERGVIGIPKVKFQKPQFEGGQNEFVQYEMAFKSFDPGSGEHLLTDHYDVAADVPDFTSAAAWDTFFADLLS